MRRYKRILAIVLAASLTVGGFATPDSIKASSVAGIENTTDESTDDDSMHTDTDQQEKVSDHNAVDNEEKTDEIDKEENDGKKDDTKENDTKENNTKDTVNTENTDTEDKKNNADKINTTESINTTEGINTTESINATEGIGDINSTEYDAEQDDGIMLLDAGVSLELLAADSYNSGVTWMADSDTIKATLKGFVLLSNCPADSLQNKEIIVESTGSSNITEEVEYNGQKYKYAGIGTADCPFMGTLSAGQITTDTTLFGGISSQAKVNINLIWVGDGSKPFYAQQYVFADAGSHSLFNNTDSTTSVTVSVADGKTIGSLIGTVSGQAGTLKIGRGVEYPAKKEQIAVNSSENAGLICNTLEKGTIQLDGFSFPSAGYSVTANTGNAGGVIGVMRTGTALKADANTKISQLSVTANNGNAGGIVGEIENGASLIAESGKPFVLSSPSVTASAGCAGGIAGKATEEAGTTILSPTESNNNTADPKPFQIVSPTVNGKNAGGLFGDYIIVNQAMSYPTSVNLVIPTILSNGNGGGLFGVLELNNKSSYTIEGFGFTCTKSGNENNSTYGSVVGQVKSNSGVKNALFINNCKVQSKFNNDNTQYHGGLIGKVGENNNNNAAVYVEVNGTSSDGIQITVDNPAAQNRFGGIIGCLSTGSILKMTGTVKITTGNNFSKGGGIVGETAAGSAVEFNGTTDLSEVKYAWDKTNEGQLIGRQESSLIYARGDGNGNGWKFIRTNAANNTNKELNDIGNYGEVIRLQADSNPTAGLDKELIKINAEHQIELKQAADYTGNSNYGGDITLASKEGLALLAITWQTRGYFSADSVNINTKSWANLRTKKISLSADIDLTGTGILGIERDIEDKSKPYEGNFDGNNHTINLAIGETYGQRKSQSGSLETVSDKEWGNGQIYSVGNAHNTLGLFSIASGSVRNLTIDGFIHASTEKGWADIGGYAAELRGNNTFVTIENVTASESMNLRAADYTKVGGIYGECIGTVNITLNNFISKAEFDFVKSNNKDWVGGFCGVYSGNNSETTIDCQSVQLGTKITTVGNQISSGGLIGEISKSDKKRTITINSIQVNEYRLNQDKNTDNNLTTCGGVLGYLWENTDVVFNTPADSNAYALSVDNSTINAPNAPIGGLVYQGSGKWQINDRGIDIKNSIFNANTLGLLLCHAEEKNGRALYLEMTANWATAYKLENVTVGGSPAVYDEMIAYTTDNADHILDNNKNAIISLATDKRTGVDTAECNTYINRTEYGKMKPTNPNSRYYYNLDQIVASQKGQSVSGWLDTPAKLMIWDVYTYADESLKGYFPVDAGNIKGIGTDAASKATIDLTGYSYYPVDVGAMTIQNADIKFANETIEEKEKSNKSTQGNNTEHTQHYAMHGGLFRNMISSEDVTTIVEKVTFQGSIGKVNGTSGVLSFGNIEGNAAVTPQRFHTLKFSKVEFSAFRVTDAGTDYAPILINQTGSYTTLVFNDVKATGYGDSPQKPAGSSLLGNIGGPDKTQISLTFNKMKLPDKPNGNGGIFTHATFLESFQYKSGGIGTAIYNFYKAEDWNGTNHRHDVTYGSEISDSVEYKDLQHWYYDEQTYGQSEGYVRYENPNDTGEDCPDFKAYLPYVHTYDKQSKASHEIKVNQRIADLLEGCGTYGHPYKITTALEMKTIADYIATATPQTGWKVQVTGDQSAYHTAPADADSVYEYDGTGWYQVQKQSDTDDTGNVVVSWQKTGKTVSNDMMHCYILSAYYDIRAEENTDTAKNKVLELENFAGLGTELYPFRGVVVSNNGSTVKISGDNIANGFIVYSYGSVVKDITIQYSGKGKTLTYQKPDDDDYQPKSFFGGVIGCIMGGDNIIDNVNVSMDTDWTLTLDGNNNYLIQAGGYVGSVSGGGVIFRNIDAENHANFTGLTASHPERGTSLYVNPYVGRILDGYAFSEGCVIDNGTQNYKINQLTNTTGDDITTKVDTNNDYTVTIQNAQGLLLMSAIINSGAAGAGGTYAYYGTAQSYSNYKFGNGIYGKIRNASYQYVGKTDNKAAEDFEKSIKDDTLVPAEGNAPYLITKYSNGETFLVAGYSNGKRNQVDFQLSSNSTYDMKEYGNGYQGISARYLSNAVNAGSNTLGTVYVKPFVKGFNGNGSTIKVDMQMKEYADDDFHGISFGGVFNLIWAAKATELTDKVLAQYLKINDSIISLSYCNADGNAASGDSNMSPEQGKYCVGVGGFAGNSAQNSLGNEENASYVFRHIVISHSNFTGPISAGGLMGSAGLGNSAVNRGVGQLLNVSKKGGDNNRNNFGVNLVNCKYDNLSVTAKYAAGGMVGGLFCNKKESWFNPNDSNDRVRSSVSVTEEDYKTVGKDSSIVINNTNTDTDTYAGGIFGAVATALYVNDENLSISDVYQNTNKTLYTACLQDITIRNLKPSGTEEKKRYAGGVVGSIQENNCYVYHIEMKKSDASDNVISGTTAAGGMIGYAKISGRKLELQNCRAENIKLQDATGGLGGMIGIVEGSGSGSAEMKITGCISQGIHAAGSGKGVSTGGMVGLLRNNQPLTLQACIVLDSTIGSENNKSGYYGGFAGTITNTRDARLSIFDSELTNTKINGQYAGGIISAANGRIYGSNILLDQVSVAAGEKAGLIFGAKQPKSYGYNLYMAGISVKGNSTANNDKTRLTSEENISNNGYIALADYEGSSMTAGNQNPTAGTAGLLGAEGVAPYVVTSPKNSMSVVDTDGTEKYLFGDSTSWSTDGNTFKLEAQKILEEAETQQDGKFVYNATGVTLKSSEKPDGFDFSTVFSTYNQNQLEKAEKDFPVLMITGNESDKIGKYLDIVTNGGYSQAKKLNGTNGTHVTAEAKVYNYNAATGKFIASNDTPALQINNNGTNQMSFQADATDYDNQKNRFTLLTVTFAENGHKYHVQVPIIVRRVLEMDFTATLSYGTHFRADDYANLTGHILDSFGNAMTGYLTYAYNSSLGEVSAFGWQNYVDAGGDVTQSFAKSIEFHLQRGKIPAGTQLTLVDCQDKNKKAYFYTVTEEEEKQNRLEFLYSNFKATDGVTAYKNLSIGEALEAKAEKSGSGKFIAVNADGKPLDVNGNIVDNIGTSASGISPTVKIDDRYYRLPQDGEDVSKLDKYTVTMDDHIHNENYYLVITFPETTGKEPINGYITTNVNGNIPMHLTDTLRQKNYNGKGQTDSHSDTASTFQISSGYTQSLEDQDQRNPARKEIKLGDSALTVDILDTITFSNEQFYNSTDNLFLKFTGNLSIVTSENGTEKVDTSQFPAGTKGKVQFYVYSKSGDHTTYYKYDSSTHNWKQVSVEGAAVEYPWISEGYHMELLLSEDGTPEKAVNLQQIRSIVKGNDQSGNSTFYVKAVLEAELPAAGLDVIPAASLVNDMPEEYAKLGYLSQISTEKESLAYSSNRALLTYDQTKVKYYRNSSVKSTLTYDADDVNQLGINPYDLEQNLDRDKKNVIISTTAEYDLSMIPKMETLLRDSKEVRFSLTVSQKDEKDGNTENYKTPLTMDAKDYMDIKLVSPGASEVQFDEKTGIWSWSIPKEVYWDEQNSKLKTIDGVFDGDVFIQNLNLLVRLDNVEEKQHFYSNYKVELRAEIVDKNSNVLDQPNPESDYLIYTLAKIRPEFVE